MIATQHQTHDIKNPSAAQVSVWKLYTNVLTSVAPLVNYVKAWREFTEDSEPMRFHEFHLQKNYLSSESILELAELCLELNKTPPVRDDLRMKLPGTYKYSFIDTFLILSR